MEKNASKSYRKKLKNSWFRIKNRFADLPYSKDRMLEKIKSQRKRRDLVETTITIRTNYLEKQVKSLCDYNFKIALLAFISSIITAINTLSNSVEKVNLYIQTMSANDNESTETTFPYVNVVLGILGIGLLILALYSFYKSISTYRPTKFVNKVVKDQYDVEDYTAVFIIKAMFDNIPKILVFRSETWQSYFLPYCHYNNKLKTDEEIKKSIKVPLAELLEINVNDFDIYSDFSKNEYVTIKKNPTHKSMSRINYRFYYVKFKNPYLGGKFLNGNLQHFIWKSKYELTEDKSTQLNNGDMVTIIDELSLINQSKLAFPEKVAYTYEIPSRYRIIWNITNTCHFDCSICATNSSCTTVCKTSYDEKIQILLNLASINGYIDELDISGGDPLMFDTDRDIIRKANQILSYTDIKVTTTGSALESLSVNELIETVKKCEITYDIPFEICKDELKAYRDYNYNYNNFRQLERFSKSGVNIELNIHIPILPVTTDKELIQMLVDDLDRINPTKIKLIRLMPVGRCSADIIDSSYSPEDFIEYFNEAVRKKGCKFDISYNCSLGCQIKDGNTRDSTLRSCGMLTKKLGIDCNGFVFACIWGAYIRGFEKDITKNPFYLGDLKKETMHQILTKPQTIKLTKKLATMTDGCRVCALVESLKTNSNDVVQQMLMDADPLKSFKIEHI